MLHSRGIFSGGSNSNERELFAKHRTPSLRKLYVRRVTIHTHLSLETLIYVSIFSYMYECICMYGCEKLEGAILGQDGVNTDLLRIANTLMT